MAVETDRNNRTVSPGFIVRTMAALLTAAIVASVPALAGTVTWDAGGDAVRWHDPLNWSGDAVPLETDDVIIDLVGTYTVLIDADAVAASLALGAGAASQTLELQSGNSLTVAGDTALVAGGTLLAHDDVTIGGRLDIAFDAALLIDDLQDCCDIVVDVAGGDVLNQGTLTMTGSAGQDSRSSSGRSTPSPTQPAALSTSSPAPVACERWPATSSIAVRSTLTRPPISAAR